MEYLKLLEDIDTIRDLRNRGDIQNALRIIDEVKKKIQQDSMGTEKNHIQILLCVENGYCHLQLEQLDTSKKLVLEGLQYVEGCERSDFIDNAHDDLLNILGRIQRIRGEYDNALISFQTSLDLRRDRGDLKRIAATLTNIGVVHNDQGQLVTALQFFEQSLEIKEQLGDQKDIARTLNNIGIIYAIWGEIDTALEYQHRSLTLKDKIGTQKEIASSLNNLGATYLKKGDFDKSKTYIERSLIISENLGFSTLIANANTNLGEIYYNQGNSQLALHHLEIALSMKEKRGNPVEIVLTLSSIFEILIETQPNLSEPYMEKIKNIAEDEKYKGNNNIQSYYLYIQGIYLKNSKRNRDKTDAERIFIRLLADDNLTSDITFPSTKHLTELLLMEFKTYGESVVLDEIQNYLQKMIEFAKNQRIMPVLIESLILESKLAYILGDIEKSINLLDQANNIAMDKGYTLLIRKINEETAILINSIDKMQNVINKNYGYIERMEELKIVDYLKAIKSFID